MILTPKIIAIGVIVLLVIGIILFIYFSGKKAGKGKPVKQVQIPPGVYIPTNWTPRPAVIKLYNAIDGAGTDEDAIFNTLDPLNEAQLALVYNDFAVYTKEKGEDDTDLMNWFEEDLSGGNLQRAVGYFKGVV